MYTFRSAEYIALGTHTFGLLGLHCTQNVKAMDLYRKHKYSEYRCINSIQRFNSFNKFQPSEVNFDTTDYSLATQSQIYM